MLLIRCARALALFLPLTAIMPAQTSSDKLSSFEVASIKPSPTARYHRTIDPTLLSVVGLTLQRLVMMAYDVPDFQTYLVTGGPGWVETDPYEIEARTGSPASRQEMLLMLRALLSDRFQLKFHRETRTLPTNVLVVAKGGPKFGPAFHEVKEGDPPVDPAKQTVSHMTFPGVPFQVFVDRLRLWMAALDPVTHRKVENVLPVIDETGLAGRYVIVFNADPQEDWSSALEHQLGLKLEQRKVPMEMIVIDSAARPSGN
jgi:uncharacterized protein (TIGR03435 family)